MHVLAVSLPGRIRNAPYGMGMARHGICSQRCILNRHARFCRTCCDGNGCVLDTDPGLGASSRPAGAGIGKADPGLRRPRRHFRRYRSSAARSARRVFPTRADDKPIPQIRGAIRSVAQEPAFRDIVSRAAPHQDDAGRHQKAGHFNKPRLDLIDPAYSLGERHYSTPKSSQLKVSLSLSYIASIDTKIISKSNMLLLKKISEKYLLDKERIIIFQFE